MPLHPLIAASFRIEVSGWDLDENFFVEKTELDAGENRNKKLLMRHRVRDRALVFVRPLVPVFSPDAAPTAFQVESVRAARIAGLWDVSLVQLHPRDGDETNGAAVRATAREDGQE